MRKKKEALEKKLKKNGKEWSLTKLSTVYSYVINGISEYGVARIFSSIHEIFSSHQIKGRISEKIRAISPSLIRQEIPIINKFLQEYCKKIPVIFPFAITGAEDPQSWL